MIKTAVTTGLTACSTPTDAGSRPSPTRNHTVKYLRVRSNTDMQSEPATAMHRLMCYLRTTGADKLWHALILHADWESVSQAKTCRGLPCGAAPKSERHNKRSALG